MEIHSFAINGETVMHTDVHEMTYSWNTNKKVVQNALFDSPKPLKFVYL